MTTQPTSPDQKRTTWKPFIPDSAMGRPSVIDRVTLLRSGQVRLSEDIVNRLGKPAKIQLLTNGDASAFAVCPATTPAGSAALSRSGRQHEFRAARLFATLGKSAELITWPLELSHSWDGDLLVIDISTVPTAEAQS